MKNEALPNQAETEAYWEDVTRQTNLIMRDSSVVQNEDHGLIVVRHWRPDWGRSMKAGHDYVLWAPADNPLTEDTKYTLFFVSWSERVHRSGNYTYTLRDSNSVEGTGSLVTQGLSYKSQATDKEFYEAQLRESLNTFKEGMAWPKKIITKF